MCLQCELFSDPLEGADLTLSRWKPSITSVLQLLASLNLTQQQALAKLPLTLQGPELLSNDSLCLTEDGSPVDILFLVHTAVPHFRRREQMRRTYMAAEHFRPYKVGMQSHTAPVLWRILQWSSVSLRLLLLIHVGWDAYRLSMMFRRHFDRSLTDNLILTRLKPITFSIRQDWSKQCASFRRILTFSSNRDLNENDQRNALSVGSAFRGRCVSAAKEVLA